MVDNSLKISTLFTYSILFTLSTTVVTEAGQVLEFGLYTSEKPTTLVKKFRPILNSLQTELSVNLRRNIRIKLSIAKSYDEGIRALVDGKVDFSRLGPASYVLAKTKNPELSLLVMETKDGKKYFNGMICVNAASGISNITELKGKRFAFGDYHSTIGRYLSQDILRQNGVTSNSLSEFRYLGRHDRVGYAVANHHFDAGAIKESTLNKLVKRGKPLRAIASFKNVTKPWVARADLDIDIKKALQSALLNLKDRNILRLIKKDGFVEAKDSDYEIVRQSIKANQLFFKDKPNARH